MMSLVVVDFIYFIVLPIVEAETEVLPVDD